MAEREISTYSEIFLDVVVVIFAHWQSVWFPCRCDTPKGKEVD